MSAYGLHPTFKNQTEYRAWLNTWRLIFHRQVKDTREAKRKTKALQRDASQSDSARAAQKDLKMRKVMGHKLMTLLNDARVRWARMREMAHQIKEQNSHFPLDLGKCPVVDFHYNKGSTEFPDLLPMWVVKAKGQTLYLPHVEFDNVTFSTRELPDKSTRGMLRVRHCFVSVDDQGTARLAGHG